VGISRLQSVKFKPYFREEEIINYPNKAYEYIQIQGRFAIWNSKPEFIENKYIWNVNVTMYFGRIWWKTT